MSRTHADEFKDPWFKRKYFLDNGYLKPFPGTEPEHYNPLNFYKEGDRGGDSLHYIFAGLDLSNEKAIENFYSEYGPLGLFERDIIGVHSLPPEYPILEDSPVVGVNPASYELIPLEQMIDKYHVNPDMLNKPGLIKSVEAWESIEDFKKECENFKWILGLRTAIMEITAITKETDEKYEIIIELLSKKEGKLKYFDGKKQVAINFKSMPKKELMLRAVAYIRWEVNGYIEGKVYPELSIEDSRYTPFYSVSKKLTWRSDSLLTSLYLMLFLDITRGTTTKKCPRCGKWFESMKSNTIYCSVCQIPAKQERYRVNMDKVKSLFKEGKSLEEIAIQTETDIKSIIKWTSDLTEKETGNKAR